MADHPAKGFTKRLSGTGPAGIVAALVIVGANLVIAPLGALLALLWKWAARISWRDLGFRRPGSWMVTLTAGAALGVLFKLLMKALVMPLLGGPAVNPAFHFIAGNSSAMIRMVIASVIIGGLAEEFVYRGFLFERLQRFFGNSRAATTAIVLLTTLLFAAAHYPDQGLAGAEQAFIMGLTVATIFALNRSLWLPIVIHASFDITAVLLIYFGLEATVAHSLLG